MLSHEYFQDLHSSAHWVLYSSAVEYYVHVPLSTMLMCLWVLCSSGIEYYAQVALSTMLKCHWVPCYLLNRMLSIGWNMGIWDNFFTDTRHFIAPPKMMSLYKIDAFFYKLYNLNLHYLHKSIPFTPCILFFTPQQAILYSHYITIKLRNCVYLKSQYFRKAVFNFIAVRPRVFKIGIKNETTF